MITLTENEINDIEATTATIRRECDSLRQDVKRLAGLAKDRHTLRDALGFLLERCNALDVSATDFGLRNCEAIAQARAALGE